MNFNFLLSLMPLMPSAWMFFLLRK